MKQNKQQTYLSHKKRFLFNTIILVVIPVLILMLIEIFLRLVKYGDDYVLFIDFPGKEIQQHRIINPLIGKKYFQRLEYTKPCHDIFLKKKPENGFRIFVLGSSTVLGFPYDENLMFTRILQERLQDSYPEKHIEVVNTAFTAINSFSLLDFIDDVLKEEPDAILIYAGHNEFYGAMGIGSVEKSFPSRRLALLHLDLLEFRIYQLLNNTIVRISASGAGDKKDKSVRGTLMKVIAENKEIPYKGKMYNKCIDRYEKNMNRLMQKAKKNNVPVFISELVSNIRDIKPFCSVAAQGYPPASVKYNEGLQSDTARDYEKAKSCYYMAKDLDCIRFRASEEINEIIVKLAHKHGAVLVPMKTSFFEEVSPNKIIGANLMTEHVHPNIDGYFLMADAFFYSLAESKLPGEKLSIVNYRKSEYYRNNWGFTELDSLLGVHRVNALKYYWPYQPYDAPFVDYREVYRPTSKIDSLAFNIIRLPEYRTNEAHLAMAHYYSQQKDFYNAFREYHAAIRCNPFQVKDYLEAIDCLIEINDLPLAMKFIDKSLELQETFHGYFRKGELLIIKGNYPQAIRTLKKAQELDSLKKNTAIILAKLHEAYYFNGNEQKSSAILETLKEEDPDYPLTIPEKQRDYIYFVPKQVEMQIRKAIDLYNNGHDTLALDLLLKTLEVKETSLANRIAGLILMNRNDRNAMLYYLRAYPDYRKDIDFLFELGILYLQHGAKDEAGKVLDEMKRIDSKNRKVGLLEEKIVER
ncbi:MAG: hypothetical protein JXR41_03105 [Bacteroidales bacterium]|nr:hypothetical protein [Bacteroidales bacterium]MBN2762055.1 hypothetical protein [Bacteroidales bacterium]